MDAPPVAASSPDLDAFHEDLDILAVRIPKNQCAVALKQLSEVRLNREKVKSIVTNPAHSEERLLLLDEKYKDISYLPEELLSRIHALGGEVVRHNLRLDVSHFTYDQLLRKLLPAGVEVPTAFETVGHIARLTLRPAQLPYKHIIGKAILKTIPQLRTVVNKTKNIETQFRTSQLEVIAGENDLETSVKESNCVFRLNFAEVYWNSRLGTEHARLVSLFYPNQLICTLQICQLSLSLCVRVFVSLMQSTRRYVCGRGPVCDTGREEGLPCVCERPEPALPSLPARERGP
jgi:tRNA (guanine37-N1)-methyltransferase